MRCEYRRRDKGLMDHVLCDSSLIRGAVKREFTDSHSPAVTKGKGETKAVRDE